MKKISKLRDVLVSKDIDAIIVGSPVNRRYITNFTGTFGIVLITKKDAFLITDFRYTEQANKQANEFEIIENRDVVHAVKNLIADLSISALGFEQEHVSFKTYHEWEKAFSAELIPLTGVVEELRKQKTPEEINFIKTAANIADKAFSKILDDIRPGISEMDINHRLEMYMKEEGAISSSFDQIIASGYRSALPHGVASNKIIEKGDMVTLDFGALYEGYRSDITRTVAVGEPDPKLIEIYQIVKEALDLGIDAVKDGIPCKYVDTVVRDYITEKGYGSNFGHGTGHGIGLEIHEAPFFSKLSNETLATNMVMTVEPGIYIPHLGGVRIEDDVLVTDYGCEVLTKSKKDLIIL